MWAVDERPTEDLFRKRNALLRIFMHVQDPEKLDDDTYAKLWRSFYGRQGQAFYLSK